MPDLMQFLRFKNLFSPEQPIGNDLPSQGGYGGNMQAPPDFSQLFAPKTDPYGNMSVAPQVSSAIPANESPDVYRPDTTAEDNFNKLAGAYPKREDYHPSMLRRIGAALAAVGPSFQHGRFQSNPDAMKTGMDMLDAPYNEKVTDWKNQLVPAQAAANLERYSNVNERTYATTTNAQKIKEQGDAAKNKIATDKLELQRLKQEQGTFKFDYSGPKVMISDPKTGQVYKTDIDTGSLSDSDKLERQQTNAMSRIDESASQNRQTARETKGWSVVNIPDPNDPTKQIAVRMNQDTGEVSPLTLNGKNLPAVQKPGGPGKAGLSGTMTADQLQGIQDKAKETLDVVNQLQDEKTGKLNPDYTGAIGASRMMGGQYIPGTKTRGGEVAINRLKSLLIVDLIAEMKKQSRTGATGFGQLNAKELGVLEGAASKLDPSLSEPEFNTELTRVREKLKKILQPSDGFTPTTVPGGNAKPKTAKELIDLYSKPQGGQ